jgi:hypothetical protein
MDLTAVLAKLTEEERAVIQASIDAEKSTGIEAARKKGDEIKRWMTAANALKDSLKAAELDPDSDIAEQIAALREKSGTKPKSDLEKQVVTLSKQIELVNRQLAEKETAAQASAEKYKLTRLKQELGKTLSEKVHASDFVIDGLIRGGTVTLNENDTVVWKDGESEIDFGKGVDQFLKSNPAIVRNTQNPGSGSGGGAGGSAKTIARAEFEQLAPADQMKFVKDGGKPV